MSATPFHVVPCCHVMLSEYKVMAAIGVNSGEVGRMQPLLLDIEVEVVSPEGDRIADALDYTLLAEAAQRLATEHVGLVETFACRLAREIMLHPRALDVSIVVRKPEALREGIAGARVRLGRSAGHQ